MGIVHWHTTLFNFFKAFRLEDRRLVHIIPDSVEVVGSNERGWMEQLSPPLGSIVIEVVEPNRLAWPAVTDECIFASRITDKDISDITLLLDTMLLFESLIVDVEVFRGTNMWIDNNDEASFGMCNHVIHEHNILLVELLVIKFGILLLLRIFNIEPEDIDREVMMIKIMATSYHVVSGHVLPLREMISKTVDWWHLSVSGQFRELLLQLLWGAFSCHKVELKSISLRDKGSVKPLTHVSFVDEDKCLS